MGFEVNAPAHAGEIVVDALQREGVKRIFCTPGSHVMQFYDALRQAPSIHLVTCKQEPNASLMADAFGRITGEPGVCLLTAGPGAANSIAGVAQAYGAASPLIHLTGAVPLNAEKESFHGVDDPEFVVDMYQKVTKWSVRVERIDDVSAVMAEAFHVARSGRPGPVHVEIPRVSDFSPYLLQSEKVPLPKYQSRLVTVAEVPDALVERAAERLLTAKFPVICAGKGVLRRNAGAELMAVVEGHSIPVVYPQDCMGMVPFAHDLALGHFHGYEESPLIDDFLPGCDFLLSVGIRAGSAEMREIKRFAPAAHILVGFDDAAHGGCSGDDQGVGDAKQFLAKLQHRLAGTPRSANDQLRQKIASRKAELRQIYDSQADAYTDAIPIHPGYLMKVLAGCLEPDAIVATDVGNCQMFSRYYMPLGHPLSYMQSGVWNAMSFALPTAIVAKLEHPDRDVVGLAGDGAFMMTMGDFATACDVGANIVMVLLNDGAYGQMIPQQLDQYGSAYGCEFLSPNFSKFAEACGAVGIRVDQPNDIEGAIRLALNAGKPAIVEVMTGSEYRFPTHRV